MKKITLLAVMLTASMAFAERIVLAPFTGPNAAAVRNQLVTSVCENADCIAPGKVMAGAKPDWKKAKKENVAWVVTGKVSAKGKKKTVELVALRGGAPKWKKSFALEGGELSSRSLQAASNGLSSAMGLSSPPPPTPREEPKPAPAPVEEPRPPPREEPVAERPVVREPPPPPVTEEPVTPLPPMRKKNKPTALVLQAGVQIFRRGFGYTQISPTTPLRSYDAPLIFGPDARAEFYPLALFTDSIVSGIGLEGGWQLAVMRSSKPDNPGIVWPTTLSRIEFGARFRIRLSPSSDAYIAPLVGYRMQSFTTAAAADGSTIDLLPNINYTAIKLGLAAELPFGDSPVSVFGHFAAMPVLGAKDLISTTYFSRGSAFGIDGSLGMGFKLMKWLQLRAAAEVTRYGVSFTPQPTDMYQAAGAADLYFGGNISMRLIL